MKNNATEPVSTVQEEKQNNSISQSPAQEEFHSYIERTRQLENEFFEKMAVCVQAYIEMVNYQFENKKNLVNDGQI